MTYWIWIHHTPCPDFIFIFPYSFLSLQTASTIPRLRLQVRCNYYRLIVPWNKSTSLQVGSQYWEFQTLARNCYQLPPLYLAKASFFVPSKTDWKSLVTRRKKSGTTRDGRLIVVQYAEKVQIHRKKCSLCQNEVVVICCVIELQLTQPLHNWFAVHRSSLHLEFCKSPWQIPGSRVSVHVLQQACKCGLNLTFEQGSKGSASASGIMKSGSSEVLFIHLLMTSMAFATMATPCLLHPKRPNTALALQHFLTLAFTVGFNIA